MQSEQPSPASSTATPRRIPWSFLLLIGSFIVPVLIAYSLLKTGMWAEQGTANNGNLITPPADFDQLTLRDTEGSPFKRTTEDHKKWWLLFVVPETCADSCLSTLYQIRQTYIATGAERHRVGTLVITTQPLPTSLQELFAKEYPNAVLLQGDAAELSQALQPAQLDGSDATNSQQVYLVDPMGAIFMTYPAAQDEQHAIRQGKLMLKDLQRVLKLSRIG